MDVKASISSLSNTWSVDAWLEKKRKLADTVWLEGALLSHSAGDRIYIAPAPTAFGIVYELQVSDIVEVVDTGRQAKHLDQVYVISRAYLKKDAVALRLQWMLAAEIPSEAHDLSEEAGTILQRVAFGSMLDQTTGPQVTNRRAEHPGGGSGRPAGPTPGATPGGGNRPGNGVSGVRG